MKIVEIESLKEVLNNISIKKMREFNILQELISFKLFIEDYISIFKRKDFVINEKDEKELSKEDKEFYELSKCPICNFFPLIVYVHHIDGNHENNSKENLLSICERCHHLIHSKKEEVLPEIIKYRRLIKK